VLVTNRMPTRLASPTIHTTIHLEVDLLQALSPAILDAIRHTSDEI